MSAAETFFSVSVLAAAREELGFAAGGAALHVDDLPVAQGWDLKALVASPVRSEPLGRADDLVVADRVNSGRTSIRGAPGLLIWKVKISRASTGA